MAAWLRTSQDTTHQRPVARCIACGQEITTGPQGWICKPCRKTQEARPSQDSETSPLP